MTSFKRVSKVCPICLNLFQHLHSRPKIYCSQKCFHDSRVGLPGPRLGQKQSIEEKMKRSTTMKNSERFHVAMQSEEYKNKIREAIRRKIQTSANGKRYCDKYLEELSRRRKNFQTGRKWSDESRKKLRISTINYIEKTRGPLFPRFGKNENEILNQQEKIDKCKILRQHRIYSLGYIVDGYCPETNTVYEVYEKEHKKKEERDVHRQNEIEKLLKCKFVILWEENYGIY